MARRSLFALAAAWGVVITLALVLSVLAAGNDTLPGDRALADWAQDWPSTTKDVSDFVRALTGTGVVLATGFALALVLWLRGHRAEALLTVCALAVLPLLQTVLKEVVDRPRPSPELVDVRAEFDSPSFPSGHVMSGTVLYALLLYLALTLPLPAGPRWALAVPPAALLAASGPANVYLGVHWPSDVLGGWLWAAVVLVPVFGVDQWRRARVMVN